jgi:hypothetical protein
MTRAVLVLNGYTVHGLRIGGRVRAQWLSADRIAADIAAPTRQWWLSAIQRSSSVLGLAAGVITPETGFHPENASLRVQKDKESKSLRQCFLQWL